MELLIVLFLLFYLKYLEWKDLCLVCREKVSQLQQSNLQLKLQLSNLSLEAEANKKTLDKHKVLLNLLSFYVEKGILPEDFLDNFNKNFSS